MQSLGDSSVPSVMLVHKNIAYSSGLEVQISTNKSVTGLRLVGLEGASGCLVVLAASHIDGLRLKVSIPFILARCPIGFSPPPSTLVIDPDVVNRHKYLEIGRFH